MKDMISKAMDAYILKELGGALERFHKSAHFVATFPRALLATPTEKNAKEIETMISILDKAKEVDEFLSKAKEVVCVPKETAAPDAGNPAKGDTCNCAICNLRRSLTQPAPRQKSAVPTSSLDIILEMILGAPAAQTPAPAEQAAPVVPPPAPTAEQAPPAGEGG